MKLAKEFIKFAVKELGMKSLPKNIKFEGNAYSTQHLSFGTYNPTTDEIVVVKGERHPVDVLRTLAHELVHHKQREDGQELNGEDGSNTENEANAKAGELMRKFRSLRPEIFNVGPWGQWGYCSIVTLKMESLHSGIIWNRRHDQATRMSQTSAQPKICPNAGAL